MYCRTTQPHEPMGANNIYNTMLARVKEQNWHPAREQPRYIKPKMPGALYAQHSDTSRPDHLQLTILRAHKSAKRLHH